MSTSTAADTEAASVQAQARHAYRQSVAEGQPLTGAELGEMFGRSDRWGRKVIAAARYTEANPHPTQENGGQFRSGRPTHTATEPAADPAQVRNPASTPNGTGRRAGTAPAGNGPTTTVVPLAHTGTRPEVPPFATAGTSTTSPVAESESETEPATGSSSSGTPQQPAAPGRSVTTMLAVLTVAVVAAVASYDHQRLLAETAGEDWRAWLWPLSVDGLIVAASMSMLARKRAGLATGTLPWVAFAAGIAVSIAANVASAEPTVIGRLVAAWPPLALLLAWELLTRAPHTTTTSAEGRKRS